MQLSRKWRAAGAIALCSVMASGCYGSFNLTRKAYKWNGDAFGARSAPYYKSGPAWGSEAIYLVLGWIIYPVTGLVDAVVLNSIEFWTGDNPISAVTTITSKLDDTHDLTLERVAADKVEVKLFEKGALVGTYYLDTQNGVNTTLLDASGSVLGTAEMQPDGTVALLEAR